MQGLLSRQMDVVLRSVFETIIRQRLRGVGHILYLSVHVITAGGRDWKDVTRNGNQEVFVLPGGRNSSAILA